MSGSRGFDEEALHFEFDDTWQVVQYDAEPIFQQGIKKVQGTHDVDFVALRAGKQLFLIEVKDFRGYRIQNKKRISNGELADLVAQKVRDTVAALVGARRCRPDDETWRQLARALEPVHEIRVVLWLEEDPPSGKRDIRADSRLSILRKDIEKRLSWLDVRAVVESRSTGLPGVTVTGLARKPA
jgi:hypothetical protein